MDIAKLTLGTVQLGQLYGVVNRSGQPSQQESFKILQAAYENGVRSFDTARVYGDSEAIIGAWIKEYSPVRASYRLATKLAPLPLTLQRGDARTEESIEMSLRTLGVEKIDVFLFHRWSDRKKNGVFQAVKKFDIHFKKIGVSAIDYQEVIEALDDFEIKFIQLPYNILDWRGRADTVQKKLMNRPDVEIQARSSLLQGLLTGQVADWPVEVEPIALKGHIDGWVNKWNRQNWMDLCFSYVASTPWVHNVVFGVETLSQLVENIKLFGRAPLPPEALIEVAEVCTKAMIPENLLSPHLWKLKKESV